MAQTANELLRDKTIAHMIYLERYSKQVVNKIMRALADTDKSLVAQLKQLELDNRSALTIARIDKQLESVRAIMNESSVLFSKNLTESLNEVALYEQEWQHNAITESSPIKLDVIAVSANTLIAAVQDKPLAGKILKEWIDKLDTDSYSRIQSAVRQGLIEGRSYAEITKQISGTKALQYTDGIKTLNSKQAQALASTAVSHSVNVAREETYKANSDLIKGLQWCSALDLRTTAICKSLDGKVFPVGEGQRPPAHFRCRSSMTAVLKSWRELGLKEQDIPIGSRQSMDGQVSETLNYEQWLRKQSHERQNEALGVGKAEMFRNGTPLDGFVDNGKELTLAQMRMKEGL